MKRILMMVAVAAGLAVTAAAQDRPGFSFGGFYESRIDNRVNDENMTVDAYGGRIQYRDERWFSVFVDIGAQSAEWNDAETDPETFFGIGGTLWLARAEDLMVPLDLGVYGGFTKGDWDIERPGHSTINATYTTWTAQVVIRSEGNGTVRPYVRAGVKGYELEAAGYNNDQWQGTNPALNAGFEFLAEPFTLAVEGNYSEGFGFGVLASIWF